MMNKILIAATASVLALTVGSGANAATITVGAAFEKVGQGFKAGEVVNGVIQADNNDCSGYFGKANEKSAEWCDVGRPLGASVSPWIAKFDTNENGGGTWSQNTFYSSLSSNGAEFNLNGSNGSSASGTWNYTPGVTDPAIRFWAAKAGPGFNLYWTVNSTSTNCVSGLNASNYKLSCLNEALSVLTGRWATPEGKGLSHITFYDTGSTPPVIPLPAAGWLLLAGVGGLAAMRRKKKAA